MKPYVLPFATYLLLTKVAAYFPDYYAWSYPAAVIVVGLLTIGLVRGHQLFRPHLHILAGIAVGLLGIALWIGISYLHPEQQIAAYLPSWLQPEARVGFNPFEKIADPIGHWGFVAMRLIGLVILVPIAEELFWRGFLLRWLISPDWQKQPLGRFTMASFAGVTVLFTLVHPEWLAAAVYCSLLNALIYWKRELWTCIVAHGTSNLVLGLYILCTESWSLW